MTNRAGGSQVNKSADIRTLLFAQCPEVYNNHVSTWRRRLLLVEDDQLLATLLTTILEGEGLDVSHAKNAATAMKKVKSFDPDVAVLDVHLGEGPSGLNVGQVLQRKYPHVGLVFLTRYPYTYEHGVHVGELPSGSALLSKSEVTTVGALKNAIELALNDSIPKPTKYAAESPLSPLTNTQIEILRLVACGLTNSAIAAARSTKERTVEQRLKTIYAALKIPGGPAVNQRVEATRVYVAEAGEPSVSGSR